MELKNKENELLERIKKYENFIELQEKNKEIKTQEDKDSPINEIENIKIGRDVEKEKERNN